MSARQTRYDPGMLRVVAIRLQDSEPITRTALQYDFLENIFDNTASVFTDPYSPSGPKLTFRDLYVNTLTHATKASKALRDKIIDSPAFGTAFAMLSLVTNVGRIPSTMSFFPEMTTKLRTYHPIPCLHSDPGNLQDAPRIKHILKSCFLEDEAKSMPTTPAEIISLSRAGKQPPTTVVNLMTVLSSHLNPVSEAHFPVDFDFLDLFLDWSTSSSSRSRAFLWLCYHYLEAPAGGNEDNYDDVPPVNPFSDPGSSPEKLPALVSLTPEESALENQEPEKDKELCNELLAQRTAFLKTVVVKPAKETKSGKGTKSKDLKDNNSGKETQDGTTPSSSKLSPSPDATPMEDDTPAKKPKPKDPAAEPSSAKPKKAKGKAKATVAVVEPARHVSPVSSPLMNQPVSRIISEDYDGTPEPLGPTIKVRQNTYPPEYDRPMSQPSIHRHTSRTPESSHHDRFSPYKQSYAPPRRPSYSRNIPRDPSRSMLEHAWSVVSSSDPLMDSDEEMQDDFVRDDYIHRIHVLDRLQGKTNRPLSIPDTKMKVDIP